MIVIADVLAWLTSHRCAHALFPLIFWWLLARRAGWC
jgi:hypothetical protein